MYTTVRVLEVRDDRTVLVGCSTEACNGCKAEMFCNNKNDNSFVVRNDDNINLKKGDEVELFLPPGKTICSTVLVFALPLLLFPAGYLLSKYFLSVNELLNALSGFVFMALAFIISAVVTARNRQTLMPVITRVL